jgi:hypothetical protein
MNYRNSVQQYNNTIRNLWESKFKKAINASNKNTVKFSQPCFHITQNESPVWLIGMNPSLVKSDDKHSDILTRNSKLTDSLIEKLAEDQRNMHENHQYFKTAKDFFANDVGIDDLVNPIFHDLYPVRHTNQKEFVKFLEDNADFRKKLDEATKNLIDGIMPDIIVIANAKASELMQKIFFGKNEAKKIILQGETKRTYRLNGKKTDMIFSSMLSGQRALDTYSRTRLAREISKTWKDRNN